MYSKKTIIRKKNYKKKSLKKKKIKKPIFRLYSNKFVKFI